MEKWQKANRVIENLIKEGRNRFILYPFGEQGMDVKRILNERYGIEEEYIVDNKLSKISINKKIISLDELVKVNLEDMLVLITSDREDIYSEIRYSLMQYVNITQIVDLFSKSMYFDKNVFFDPLSFPPYVEGQSVGGARLASLEAAVRELYYNGVEGSIAECGVNKGYFANWMSRLMPDRKFYLFDTFTGFDNRDKSEKDTLRGRKTGMQPFCRDTSVDLALSNIGYRANCIVKQGWFPETAVGFDNEKFAFVHLDMDLYKPTLSGLEFFWPKMSWGGIIIVHDFRHYILDGVRKAVIEFAQKERIGYSVAIEEANASAVFSKPLR